MKKQTKKQLRKEYNALSIECHHLITEQLRELKELQKLYDEKDNEIKELQADILDDDADIRVISKENKELELRVRNLLDGKEIKALLEDAHLTEVILTDRIDEKDNKIKELQAHHDEVVQGVKERYMERIDEKDKEIRDLHEWTTAGDKMIAAKDAEIKQLRADWRAGAADRRVSETLKKLFGGGELRRWVPEKDGV